MAQAAIVSFATVGQTVLTLSILLSLATFAAAWLGAWLIQRRSVALGLMVTPNERSSHTVPTARGGGVAAALAAVIACGLLGINEPRFLVLAVLCAAIALLGFVDDLISLPARLRFPLQTLIMSLLVLVMQPLAPVDLAFSVTVSGMVLAVVVTIAGLWWVNLFNFMDGIDGIAASQAAMILLCAMAIWWSVDPSASGTATFGFALIAATGAIGFLARNWPPAKIFMGDAGSYFFAFSIFAVALLSVATGPLNYGAWVILVSAFVTDATICLLRRLQRGEPPWRAHRRHAYQQLARRWGHLTVTLAYLALVLFWATPLAWLAVVQPHMQWIMAPIAYLPLIVAALWAGSGSATERYAATT